MIREQPKAIAFFTLFAAAFFFFGSGYAQMIFM